MHSPTTPTPGLPAPAQPLEKGQVFPDTSHPFRLLQTMLCIGSSTQIPANIQTSATP